MQAFTDRELIQTVEAAPTANAQHLLSLFDSLAAATKDPLTSVDPLAIFTDAFTAFYLKQAQKTTATNPDSLAAHLLLIAQKALIEQLWGQENDCLNHAKAAAQALIQSQCPPEPAKPIRFVQQHWFTVTASIMFCSIIGWYGWMSYQINQQPKIASQTPIPDQPSIAAVDGQSISASQAAAMYQTFALMRSGTCRYLEAIQIPDAHKAVYIENVVGGKVPSNLKDLAIANAYLAKIQCSYTPMLMKKST